MDEWDELLEHIEAHEDDPISDSCGDDKMEALLDGSVIGKWIKEHPEEYAAYLLQNAWDLRLPPSLRNRARELLFHLNGWVT